MPQSKNNCQRKKNKHSPAPIYCCSHRFLRDLFRCVLGRLGFPTHLLCSVASIGVVLVLFAVKHKACALPLSTWRQYSDGLGPRESGDTPLARMSRRGTNLHKNNKWSWSFPVVPEFRLPTEEQQGIFQKRKCDFFHRTCLTCCPLEPFFHIYITFFSLPPVFYALETHGTGWSWRHKLCLPEHHHCPLCTIEIFSWQRWRLCESDGTSFCFKLGNLHSRRYHLLPESDSLKDLCIVYGVIKIVSGMDGFVVVRHY